MSVYNIGDKFHNLTIVELTTGTRSNGKDKYLAICQCDCGEFTEVERHNLKSGNTRWCKICSSKSKSKRFKKHGNSISRKEINPEGYRSYYTWQAMKRRCFNKKDKRYSDYGGRGISVCDSWLESYENFLDDMGYAPTDDHQIDRIDNNGDYEPSNCRWVTRTENARNKRSNRIITAFGKTQTLVEWEEETGINAPTIRRRIDNYGRTPEEAVSTPPRQGRGLNNGK